MKLRSSLMLLTTAILWGASFILIKIGLEEIQPITLALLRFAIATPILMLMAYSVKGLRGLIKDWKGFLVLGLTGVTFYHVFQNIGLNLTSASEASIIIASNPIFIAILGHYYLKERLSPGKVLGIVLAFIGVSVIILRGGITGFISNIPSILGDLLCLASVLCWAVYSVYGKKKLADRDATEVTAFSFLFGTVFLVPLMIGSEGFALPSSAISWASVLILSIFCSGLAYLLWYKALKEVSAYEAGTYLFFIPVVSVLLASLILGEQIDLLFVVGAASVMAGVLITARRS
ncbi:MAG: DMT family transporter [Candidatus Verstraetearchaeota archaeon]|nr:DMT family transporter [Candidatus Verstraetearchaeota archaeon]